MQRFLTRVTAARSGGLAPVAWCFVFLTVALMSAPLVRQRLDLVRHNHDVGHADTAAYAQQARSLAEGRWGRIPYITNFFHVYARAIVRRDDQWPVFPALLMTPAFRILGVDAAHGRATMVVIGGLVLPLAAAWLAGAATGQAWAALVAGLLMLLPERVMSASTTMLGDVPLMVLVALFGAALCSSLRHRTWLIAAGIFGACAYLTKGSHLLLLPLLPVFAAILHGPRIVRDSRLWAAILAFMVVAFPVWFYNARTFGNPLHSTQNYVASFYGLDDGQWRHWDPNFYAVYWGRDLPSVRDRFRDRKVWERSVRLNSERYLRALLLGIDKPVGAWEGLGPVGPTVRDWVRGEASLALPEQGPWLKPVREWDPWYAPLLGAAALGWGALASAALVLFAALFALLRLFPMGRRRRLRVPEILRTSTVLALLMVFEAVFVILTWRAMDRLIFAVLPPAYALALALPAVLPQLLGWGGGRVFARFGRVIMLGKHVRWAAAGVLCVVTAALWAPRVDALAAGQLEASGVRVREKPYYPRYHPVGEWVRENLPADAVIMTRNPWELTFYCPPSIRAVGLPHAPPGVIFAVARYYGVTHFIFDRRRPGLGRFLAANRGAFRLLTQRPMRIYAVDYERFKTGTLARLWKGEAPLR